MALNKATYYSNPTELPLAVTSDVAYHTPDMRMASGYTAIINPETNQLFSIVSPKYKIVKHVDVLSKVEEAISKHIEYGRFERTLATFANGARMQAKYVFPDVTVSVKGADNIHPSVEIRNGYDGMWGFGVLFGAFRLVCSNGLVIGQKVLNFRKKHYNPAQQFLMQDMLSDSMENFSEQTKIWKSWSEQVMEQAQIAKSIEDMELREKEVEGINNTIETSTGITLLANQVVTKWILFNIIAQYVTHNVVSINRQVELEARMRKVF